MSSDLKVRERWYSDRVQTEVTVVRWGLVGTPVLVFPSAGGDAEEIEGEDELHLGRAATEGLGEQRQRRHHHVQRAEADRGCRRDQGKRRGARCGTGPSGGQSFDMTGNHRVAAIASSAGQG